MVLGVHNDGELVMAVCGLPKCANHHPKERSELQTQTGNGGAPSQEAAPHRGTSAVTKLETTQLSSSKELVK